MIHLSDLRLVNQWEALQELMTELIFRLMASTDQVKHLEERLGQQTMLTVIQEPEVIQLVALPVMMTMMITVDSAGLGKETQEQQPADLAVEHRVEQLVQLRAKLPVQLLVGQPVLKQPVALTVMMTKNNLPIKKGPHGPFFISSFFSSLPL